MRAHQIAAAAVPEGFAAGLVTEHGPVARRWLAGLPDLLTSLCQRWELSLGHPVPRHGHLSLVWPVTHGPERLALKLTVPSQTFTREVDGLAAWDGRSMVRLDRCDVELGAALLQWLDASRSLADVPVAEAVAVAGSMLSLGPTLDPGAASRYDDVRERAAATVPQWSRRGAEPGHGSTPAQIRAAEAALARVTGRSAQSPARLVNHDLHYENVIRDRAGRWVCIDPKPVLGPPEYAIAPLVWRRYRDPGTAVARVRDLCLVGGLAEEPALDWLLLRTVDYLCWALRAGLTTDPAMCRELVEHLTARRVPR